MLIIICFIIVLNILISYPNRDYENYLRLMSDAGGLRDQKNNMNPAGIINKIAAINVTQ